VPGRQRDDQIAMNRRQRAPCHDQAAIRAARESGDGALDLDRVVHLDRAQLHPERWSHGLNRAELADPMTTAPPSADMNPRLPILMTI